MSYSDGEGKVHNMIRKILRKRKCLRRHEIFNELVSFGHYEGDMGRRLREMADIECRFVPVKINGEKKRVWVYSLVKVKARAAA